MGSVELVEAAGDLAQRADQGLIDLVEVRQLIERAGREGDIDQIRQWYGRLGSLWATSREQTKMAGEVKARLEREIGLIDLRQCGIGHTSKSRPRFPVPETEMPKWMQGHCRRLASATQEEFDRVIDELWDDPHREICTSAFRVLRVGDRREEYRREMEMRRVRWLEMRGDGLSHKEIAERDGVSKRTVDGYLAPSEARKRRAKRRQHEWRETQRLRKQQKRSQEMAARGDSRGNAYVLVDQQLLALIDEASRKAESKGERHECSAAYDLALKLRDALYRAGVEKDIAA